MLVRKLGLLRHGKLGRRLTTPWNLMRPAWRFTAAVVTGGRGFRHAVNDIDEFRLSLELSHNLDPYHWEPDEYKEVMTTISRGDCFIDVGAFWGLFSLGAAKRVGSTGCVVAIEPGPRQYSILLTNVASNDFGSIIECVEKVCTDKAGERVEFFVDPQGSMVDSAVPSPERNSAAVSRTSTTIDSLVSELQLRPSVIKIDVEGFEDLVLKGATQTLLAYKPKLFVEFHPEQLNLRGIDAESVLKYLEESGFFCEELSNKNRAALRPGHLFKFTNTQILT